MKHIAAGMLTGMIVGGGLGALGMGIWHSTAIAALASILVRLYLNDRHTTGCTCRTCRRNR